MKPYLTLLFGLLLTLPILAQDAHLVGPDGLEGTALKLSVGTLEPPKGLFWFGLEQEAQVELGADFEGFLAAEERNAEIQESVIVFPDGNENADLEFVRGLVTAMSEGSEEGFDPAHLRVSASDHQLFGDTFQFEHSTEKNSFGGLVAVSPTHTLVLTLHGPVSDVRFAARARAFKARKND